MSLFTNIPLTIIDVHERDREGRPAPKVEAKAVDGCGALLGEIMLNPWSPILRDRLTDEFRSARAVALAFDDWDYSREEAISDFSGVAHILAKRRDSDGFLLILPLREAIHDEREYLAIMQAVGKRCRIEVTDSDLFEFLPPCSETFSINARSKTDVTRMNIGTTFNTATMKTQRVSPARSYLRVRRSPEVAVKMRRGRTA